MSLPDHPQSAPWLRAIDGDNLADQDREDSSGEHDTETPNQATPKQELPKQTAPERETPRPEVPVRTAPPGPPDRAAAPDEAAQDPANTSRVTTSPANTSPAATSPGRSAPYRFDDGGPGPLTIPIRPVPDTRPDPGAQHNTGPGIGHRQVPSGFNGYRPAPQPAPPDPAPYPLTQPQWTGPQRRPQLPDDLAHPVRRVKHPGGWRERLRAASGGLITFGASRTQEQLALLVHHARTPIHGDFRLAVLSVKGGVGKTTTTVGLGSAFASLRGDRVIAVDANPDFGTLARRIPEQSAATVRTLLNDPDLRRYTDVRRHTNQSSSRLEVIASERNPAISESFDADDYRRVIAILESYYNIIMTDCGTGVVHSAMEGVLELADAIIVVTTPAVDGAQSASATLDWLEAHGYQRLVQESVVVISAARPGGSAVDINALTEHFLGRVRAVQVIPYDEHLATGSYIDLDRMDRRTRTAFLELAATVAGSFRSGRCPPSPEGW
ncbi:AAA family ATPase [Gordonia pseudamarae]|uniref:AAA family ATPase n=1 Tax=Gordonia pseudamarae TaxID=2831662 RepID=A0ABX6IMS0_9ACTN|nr:AAA family ATPase [Gordonia sp. (in: high G+C Gram-positive bacteria)]QHN28340.1 AAA family ATPase [Gordonia pseudamarae]QHN37209.1 AAA family ATPase [Gordonia pseudamarae]